MNSQNSLKKWSSTKILNGKATLDVTCLTDAEIDEFVTHLGKTFLSERIYQIEEHRRSCTTCDNKIKRRLVDAMNRAVLPYVQE